MGVELFLIWIAAAGVVTLLPLMGVGLRMKDLHELRPVFLGRALEGRRDLGEPREDRLHVAALLHGDDSAVVFFVHPAQRRPSIIVEDASILSKDGGVRIRRDRRRRRIAKRECAFLGRERKGYIVACFSARTH